MKRVQGRAREPGPLRVLPEDIDKETRLRRSLVFVIVACRTAATPAAQPAAVAARWSEAAAQAWHAQQPWLVGADCIPANAIDQLEMFPSDTFDPATIDTALALAEGLGMNTMRVLLHDLPWQFTRSAA